MERMRNKDLENAWAVQGIRQEKCAKLEEENKKLKEENEYRKSIVDIIPEGEGNVAEETIKDLQDRIKELKEEVRFLEECLDRKEKVNKSLREELSAYDREYFDEDKKAKNIFIDKSGKVIKGGEFTTLC